METIIRVIDVETTGLPPEGAVVEVGWCDLCGYDDKWWVGTPTALYVNPGRPIPPEAMAVHHITDDDVKDAPPLESRIENFIMREGAIYAAHNSRFEQNFLPMLIPWIDTLRVAYKLAPNAPGHGNQVLRYWAKLDCDRTLASPPHRAAPDAYVTACLLRRMLAKLNIKEMLDISSRPAILPKFHFGKHQGTRIEDIPRDYLRWVLDNITDDEDVQATAKHYLGLATT